MTKRKRKSRARQSSPTSAYRAAVREADRILSEDDVELRADNWQRDALRRFAAAGSLDREELARYIAAHEDQLGIAWARELLRLEIFLQAEDHEIAVAHYDQAFSRYPRCAIVEVWVADCVFRHLGDFWRARQMYHYAVESLPEYAKPRFELGFMSYLLGDLPGALEWFDQAADLISDDDEQLGPRLYLNRGLIRYRWQRDREGALADVREALRRRPDYPQARLSLKAIQTGKGRWSPW